MTEAQKKLSYNDFGGVIGCLLTYISCPIGFLFIVYFVQENKCDINQFNLEHFWSDICSSLYRFDLMKFLSFYTILIAVIYCFPTSKIVEGPVTPSGKKLKYKISALTTFFTFLAIFFALLKYDVNNIFKMVKNNYFGLMVISVAIAFLWQLIFFIKSFFLNNEDRNPQATSGNIIYDSFLGYELHPRIGELFDLKIYLYRYSMMAWVLIVLLELVSIYQDDLETLKRSPEIIIMILTHIIYCYSVYFGDEESCPHMFDIKHEGLGFSQTFGEIVIVPFFYTLPVHMVILFPDHQHFYAIRLIFATILTLAGCFVAGVSNHQKTKFRTSKPEIYPNDDVISSGTSSSLYCGGLWGLCRHPNYLGELMISFGWSLLCGFSSWFLWMYPAFLTPLLLSRIKRLENISEMNGSKNWMIYKKKVPYKMIPYIY